MVVFLGATGQLYEERAFAGPPAPPSGGHTENTLPVTHSGTGAWHVIDTTGLWAGAGGAASTGSIITIDGVSASDATFGFTQPTASVPIPPYYLMPVGTHTIALVNGATTFYSSVIDCYWRGYPFTAAGDVITNLEGPTASPTEFFPAWANQVSGPDNTAAYWNSYALNNGYSISPDDLPATSCVFCTLPGDEPYQAGETTKDTRAELNMVENYDKIAATNPSGSGLTQYGLSAAPASVPVDVIGNDSTEVRFWRFDYEFPSTWTAPVPLQNNTGPWAAPPTGVVANSGRGIWPIAPGSADGYPGTPTTSFSLAASDWTNAIKNLSNLMENQGPAVFVWASGASGGTYGAVEFRFQPTCLGIAPKNLLLGGSPVNSPAGSANIKLDQRYCTIVEMRQELFATGNGEPWVLNSMVPSGSPYFASLSPEATAASPPNTFPFFPYGMPLMSDGITPNPPFGGGYFRIWQWDGAEWVCTTAGNQYAVPGTPSIADGEIVGDPSFPQYGDTSGCVFGPMYKSNGAKLSGSIAQNQSAPFTFSVTNVADTKLSPSFLNANSVVTVGSEQMEYSTFSGTTFHVSQRGVNGTTPAPHTNGEQVWALIEPNEASPGINQGAALLTPFIAREWPLVIAPSFAAASAPSPTGA